VRAAEERERVVRQAEEASVRGGAQQRTVAAVPTTPTVAAGEDAIKRQEPRECVIPLQI